MISCILYGRNWQGVAEATRILGSAAFASKLCVQDFVEPAGPHAVMGCVKADKQPIESRQLEQSDFLLVFDPKMGMDVLKQSREKSAVIFNSRERLSHPLLKKKSLKAFFVDATGIAITSTLKPAPHPAMLGAFAKVFGKLPAKAIKANLSQKESVSFDEGFRNVKRF